jgi:hypothetical protein
MTTPIDFSQNLLSPAGVMGKPTHLAVLHNFVSGEKFEVQRFRVDPGFNMKIQSMEISSQIGFHGVVAHNWSTEIRYSGETDWTELKHESVNSNAYVAPAGAWSDTYLETMWMVIEPTDKDLPAEIRTLVDRNTSASYVSVWHRADAGHVRVVGFARV